MEKESFEDMEVAKMLNDNFVSIKVDREERPDIDAVYMSVCQVMTGSGGWPLSIIMTPDQKPFYTATYIPKHSYYPMTGMTELIPRVVEMWYTEKEKLLKAGEETHAYLNSANLSARKRKTIIENNITKKAYTIIYKSFDKINGGFDSAPKFPSPHNLIFLLRYGSADSIAMVEKTLTQIYRGGIHDHIGGGFSRYATDSMWLAPHFEKMLYDNALLVMAYLELYLKVKKDFFIKTVQRTLDYVLRELTDKKGGFYCGQDADSEGIEGKYYLFSQKEIISVLGKENWKPFCMHYNVTKNGNFEGANILNLLHTKDYEKDNPLMDACLIKLYDYRKRRMLLHKDDKILTSWNGLMIAALARAYAITNRKKYLTAAVKADEFISTFLTKDDRLLVRYRDGESAGTGMIDDYAFYIWSLLELYHVTFEVSYLEKACFLMKTTISLFFDNKNGGFYFYASDAEQLISRPIETYDGAIPSGNSVCLNLLYRLSKLTGDIYFKNTLDKQIRFMASYLNKYPAGYCFALLTVLNMFSQSKELICVSPSEKDLKNLHKLAAENSNLHILVKTQQNTEALEQIAELTKNYPMPDTGALFYLCSDNTCMPPVTKLKDLNLDTQFLD